MQKGSDTDIITGKPLEKVKADQETEKRNRDEAILKGKTEFFGLTTSGEGKKLIVLVQNHLTRRITSLVNADPEAKCLIKLLGDMGIKENEAKKAAAQLVAQKISPH